MNNKKTVDKMTNEELLDDKKKMVTISLMLTILLIVLLAMGTYISVTKAFSALVAIPFALSPIVIISLKRIKDIKQELKTRNI